MSVSDPLLKQLKAFVLTLRSKDELVTDSHQLLQQLCETLEDILRKGLKENGSWFGSSKTEFWFWITKLPTLQARLSPWLQMSIAAVKKSKKIKLYRGYGRQFIRTALKNKVLVETVQLMIQHSEFAGKWYCDTHSILGNEILIEILKSLLLELQEVQFQLQLKNASFLDITWEMPMYKQYELVPSDDLGFDLRTVQGYPIVTQIDPNSVAGEDNKVVVGDVLDEMCGQCLRGVSKSGVYFIFNQHEGLPIQLYVIKGMNKDGNAYRPIARLLEEADLGVLSPGTPTSSHGKMSWGEFEDRPPPESILPEDIEDEVPVHDSEGRAKYVTVYLGNAYLGKDGRVNMIEHGVADMLAKDMTKRNVMLELGEKELTVTDIDTKEQVFQHLYTEISACGRRTDALKYYAFISGETYCSFAKEFYCHVFEASTEDEAKVILCTIAQGFERTHLMT